MYDVMKQLDELAPPKIYYTVNAVELGPRLFPVSKHRSKRIHKKLVKRFGGEYEWTKPCIFKAGKSIFANPIFRQAIEHRSEIEVQRSEGRPVVLRAVSAVHEGKRPEAERTSDFDYTRWRDTGAKIRIIPDDSRGFLNWRVAT